MSEQQMTKTGSSVPQLYTSDELECKICYNRYDSRTRRPKVLNCLHCICAKCLQKVANLRDSSPHIISCPFCRQETSAPQEICQVQDDPSIMAILSHREKAKNRSPSELALTPANLTNFNEPSSNSSNCLVITLMELQRDSSPTNNTSTLPIIGYYRPSSVDSLTSVSCQRATAKCRPCLWKGLPHFLTWILGLFYFSSVPLGIYLLVIQNITLGIIFVSLVPSSLALCVVYGFCQCVCHETLDCLSR
ncbi:E3 ubiquitin-protein ligase RNF182-like [Heptranchias perlo]|uniref:E3 ubiquitin-protein ligase RNF182-like n=1 Tax=Heptranchias perlo TaxID=212740 RepID=UPI00355A3413